MSMAMTLLFTLRALETQSALHIEGKIQWCAIENRQDPIYVVK